MTTQTTLSQIKNSAESYVKETGNAAVIYIDYDRDGSPFAWCSESAWDRMIDNGEVEPEWCHGWIY